MAYQYTNVDVNQWTPEELATKLGTAPGQIGYESNESGSFERNYNKYLESLTPDLLIKRYSTLTGPSYFQTDQDRLQKQAYDTAKLILGRDVSAGEYASILPYFQGPNGLVNGRAAIYNLAQQYKMNPSLDPTSSRNNRAEADISGSVNSMFRNILGRDASADELAHFSNAIKTNQIDDYGLASFLKTQPEYTNAQDSQFRQGLNTELQKYDTEEFNRMKGDVISAYGRNGMAAGFDANGKSLSPSLDYALSDLMGKIASNRSAYLASLSASQYGGNKDLAIGNYQNTLNNMYSQNQNRMNNMQNNNQQFMDRGFAGADYTTQRNDFLNYLNRIPQQKPNFFDYLNAGLNTVNTGVNVWTGFKPRAKA